LCSRELCEKVMFKRGAKRTKGGAAWDISQMFKRYKSYGGRAITPPQAAARARLRKRNIRTAGFLGIEKKFYDKTFSGEIGVAVANAVSDPAANASCLNAVEQGDGESQRDGRKIVIKSVQVRGDIRGQIEQNQDDVNKAKVVRILLVQDRQTNGAQMTGTQMLTGATNVEHAYYNLQYSQRFKVLYDKTFVLQCNTVGTDGANTNSVGFSAASFKIFRNVNIPVTFTSTAENIANIADNSLHMLALSSETNVDLAYESRIRFVG